ncbi:MAG TPA: fatty acid desaturase [Steroidobacteraceae bacterium]|nr:fatty acid desaturase [Steroidobacteraceae bacterium]
MDAMPSARIELFRDSRAALANTLALGAASLGWLGSFALMSARSVPLDGVGVLLCAQSMVLAAYLIHEAAHQTLFATRAANACAGEAMSFIAGSSYASFERIRHMHIRHHLDRADLACFDFKALLERRARLRALIQALEWAYLPALEILMHLQVVWRPFLLRAQRRYLPRAAAMLAVRSALLVLLGLWSLKALLLYALAALIELHVLNFFDAFHHSFEQYFVAPQEPVPMAGRDRRYEQRHTYTNLISRRHPWLNLLVLNFGYHNAHHERPSLPWFRLPALHRELYGESHGGVLTLSELLRTWHRNRVRRVCSADYGIPADGRAATRADGFVGAHGVSFLTVV